MLDLLKKIGNFFLDTIETVVIALAVFVIIYLFLVQPHQVKGNSMLPNFEDGEYILTDKVSYRFSKPQRGDVVIFKAPKNHEVDYIKRVMGLPGETVSIKNNHVYINNNLLNEQYLPSDFVTNHGTFLKNNQEYHILPDEYFVLGDNRNHSSDSREWGPVKKEEIVGKAWFRYWPLSKLSFVQKVTY